MRCCRAGFNDKINFFDAKKSNEYIKMIGKNNSYISSLRGDELKAVRLSNAEIKKRWSIIFNESRIKNITAHPFVCIL